MPDLIQSLQSFDIGHLRIVAGFWGLDLVSPDTLDALRELAAGIFDPYIIKEFVGTLPGEAHQALDALVAAKGRIPWQDFTRRFGQLRDVGEGRRDREQVFLQPISSTEVLYYRALLGRAFFEISSGVEEFAYIPDDLLPLLPTNIPETIAVPAHLASPQERSFPILSSDRILEDACTLLAAMRMGWMNLPESVALSLPASVLLELLQVASLVDFPNDPGSMPVPHPKAVKDFLEEPRSSSLARLVRSWLASASFNELRQVPGLLCEGTWRNDPLATRCFILELVGRIPRGKWWSLSSLVRLIRESNPDFERPSGDYGSWLIRRQADDSFLHGFEHWDDVDGALIRYIITGPLYWLGIVDLASFEKGGVVTAFRLTSWATDLLRGHPPHGLAEEDGKLHAAANGRISIPLHLPRPVRYQVARFCEWESFRNDEFRYRLTPVSLQKAMQQGLKIPHLVSLLTKNAAAPLPPAFMRALNRWELKGTEAHLEQPVILRLSHPEVLEELRKSRAGRFLGEVLGPTTVVVKPGARAKILAALAELGLLTDDVTNADIIRSGEKNHK